MAINGNTLGNSCQLKLNDKDCHVYCHVGFGASFGIKFGVLSIILLKNLKLF